MRKLLFLFVLLVTGCSLVGTNQSVAGQLKGNQALVMTLTNVNDLNDLYFYYNGGTTDATPTTTSGVGGTPAQATGMVQVGQLNLQLQNLGDSVTAGGLYVSGYDPNMIVVQSRLGQDQINNEQRNCYQQIGIASTGQYDLAMFCDSLTNNYGVGVNVGGDFNGGLDGIGSITGTIRNPLQYLGTIIGGSVGSNVNAIANLGLFTTSSVSCGVTNGNYGCQVHLGNPNFSPSSASYGYLLTNLDYGLIVNCVNGCRTIPRDFQLGHVLHGVAETYPQGETYFADYDIFVNRANWNPMLNDLPQSFQVTACYLYSTVVTPSICVVPDPSMLRNSVCSPTPILFKGPQGAPVVVTEIDQSPRPGTAAFTIYIKHVGTGEVWMPGAFDQCSPYSPVRPDPQMMNAVELLDARISGNLQQLQCLGQSWDALDTQNSAKRRVIRLDSQGNGQITCLYPIMLTTGSRAPYKSALTLEFGYVYQNSIRKDVVIHRT